MLLLRKSWVAGIVVFLSGILVGLTFAKLFQEKKLPSPTISSPISTISQEQAIRVAKAIDGDTIELSNGRRIRYIGINTPETVDPRRPVECFGKEAAAKNRELVLGKEVRLEKDVSETDKYGRLLRYVYVIHSNGREVMVNDFLVREGFAFVSTYPPDVKYTERFKEAERLAREEQKGLWTSCPVSQSNDESTTSATSSQNILGEVGENCVIKGNISSGGKIYHLPGCGSYDKTAIDETAGERWFCSEKEAIDAGWRKAKNC